jgi:predicted N-formylglutamate amidohydrolase
MNFDAFIITCEHATNAVPVRWREPFADAPEVLETHRAWDPGALLLANDFSRTLKAPLFKGQVTRLLIDLNRRETGKGVTSEFSRQFDLEKRVQLLNLYHRPFRVAVLDAVTHLTSAGKNVLHLSCHSFTPVLDGKTRNAEIGLLFDPGRAGENALCHKWQEALADELPRHRTKLNYPYKGTSDGMTTWLRERFPAEAYAGIEIEMNQSFAAKPATQWAEVRQALKATLRAVLRS